eukprot:gene19019-25611_t
MVVSQGGGGGAQQQFYTHAAAPKAVSQRRAKYREEDATFNSNIMFDRRVVRGNTYAARILPADTVNSDAKSTMGPPKTKRSGRVGPPRTPEAVDGRRHMDIQTDTYLEELTDVVPEADTQTQTDAFLDRPPTPLFIPQKTGVDAVTQIENGDLFDFDFEVEPILEVLVGKVLEQGLMEVLEEEELAAMRAHQEHFEQIRNAELVATQRMEAAEKRKSEEKERRLAQERERVERERVVRQKVAASTFSRGYLSGIINSVFDNLQSNGYFYDPVMREVEMAFMPWLKEQAVEYLGQGVIARQVVKKLVAEATLLVTADRVAADARRAEALVQAEKNKVLEEEERMKRVDAEIEKIKGRAEFVLRSMEPRVVSDAQIEEMKEELETNASTTAEAALEAAKAEAGEKAREEAEAKLAEQQGRLDELKAAAEAEAAEAGDDAEAAAEGEEPPAVELPDGEQLVDVEALVAAAIEAVALPPPKEVTDGDVLSALIEKGTISKDDIVQKMAVNSMGESAFTRHPAFQPQPEPEPVPTKGKK